MGFYRIEFRLLSFSVQVVFFLWIADRTTAEQRIAFFATLAAAMDVEQTVTPVASFVPSTRLDMAVLIGSTVALLELRF